MTFFEYMGSEPQVRALQDICREWAAGTTGFWPFDDVLEAVQKPSSLLIFAAESASALRWQAAALLDVKPDSADLLYIYVRHTARRGGLGAQLLERVREELADRPGVREMFLEVRAGNAGAIAMYERAGMTRIGMRRGYYRNGDDALVYRLKIEGDGK